jgi:hypothetical protein
MILIPVLVNLCVVCAHGLMIVAAYPLAICRNLDRHGDILAACVAFRRLILLAPSGFRLEEKPAASIL